MAQSKILVADDSLTIQKVIRLALANEGYQIMTVSDGTDALKQVPLFRPQVLLLDVSLPGKNAFEIKQELEKIQGLDPMSVVLMSSAFEQVDETEAKRLNFQGRLVKPFDPSVLRKVVKDAIEAAPTIQKPYHEEPVGITEDVRIEAQSETVIDAPPAESVQIVTEEEFEVNESRIDTASKSFNGKTDEMLGIESLDLTDPSILAETDLSSYTSSLASGPIPTQTEYEFTKTDTEIARILAKFRRTEPLDVEPASEQEEIKSEPKRPPEIELPDLEPISRKSKIVSTFELEDIPAPAHGKESADWDIQSLTESTFAGQNQKTQSQDEWAINEPAKLSSRSTTSNKEESFDWSRAWEREEKPKFIEEANASEFLISAADASPERPRNKVRPDSTADIEQIVKGELEKKIREMTQKMLPDIAERIIKEEINRLLSNPGGG